MGKVQEFRLEIPGRPEFVSIARVFVGTVGIERGQLPPDRIDDLTIAVSEACTNSLEAYRDSGTTDGRIRIVCLARPSRVEVTVVDDGPGLPGAEGGAAVTIDAADRWIMNGGEGRGLALIFALVDKASLHSTPTGTTVHLVATG